MPTTITHGLATFTTGDYLDEFKSTAGTEVSERRGTDGTIKKVKDFNPTTEFSVKGGGNPGTAVGVGSLSITGITGGIQMISKFEHTEKNSDFDEFDMSGKHYPGASLG